MATHLSHPVLTQNALDVLEHRPYLQLGESPSQLFYRVAKHVASAEQERDQEKWTERFYNLLSSLKFLPNTPTLVHAGVPGHEGHSLSACFVLPIHDSLHSIMTALKDAAMVEKSGGGTGFSFSRIRPRGSPIGSVPGGALGPVEVMRIYSRALEGLTQGAVRAGAHMGQMRADHPDIFEFIAAKNNNSDGGSLANFNISVQITDKFMEKLGPGDGKWELIDPNTQQVTRVVSARMLWETIMKSAHKTGDPGLVFIDRVHETAPNPSLASPR